MSTSRHNLTNHGAAFQSDLDITRCFFGISGDSMVPPLPRCQNVGTAISPNGKMRWCDEHKHPGDIDYSKAVAAYNATYGAGINPEGIKGLVEALRLANDAMEHMGEKLNEMDVVDEESILKTTPAFHAVHEALANLKLEEPK